MSYRRLAPQFGWNSFRDRRDSCAAWSLQLPTSFLILLTIPYYRIRITSGLGPEAVTERLRAVSDKSWWRVWDNVDARFVGQIRSGRIRLSYFARGRNSYRPRIRGTIRPDGDGSVVDAQISIHPSVGILMFGFAILPFGLGVRDLLEGLMWLSVVTALHVLMYYIGFRPEAWDAEALLRELATAPVRPANTIARGT